MKFTLSRAKAHTFKADIISIGCYERPREDGEGSPKRPALIKHADGGIALDRALGGSLSRQIKAEGFTGERGASRLLFTAGKIPARFVLLVGLGPREKQGLEVLREAGATMAKAALELKAASIALVIEQGPMGEEPAAARARAIAEGVILGGYRFDRYKTGDETKRPSLSVATFLYRGDQAPVRAAIEQGQVAAEAALACRDMVNAPASEITPSALARRAREIAKGGGLSCAVWGLEAIRRERMNGLLAVSKGSKEPPAFIILRHRPRERARAHVAIVGKGVTFDAGGISLKQPRGMEAMKGDMAGAASALAAMEAVARISPPVEVTALIPAAENLPDGGAIKPGDIYTARSGKTIEVVNTDAEGRLLLADALSYAAELKPDAIVDIATLTGGAAYALGELYTPILGSDQRLVDRLRHAADGCGEPAWQLPIVEAYRKGYTQGIADLNNVGKGKAQTILGAIFLKEFVGGVPWAHLDIAATSWSDEDLPLSTKGGTGTMVRTLISFICNFKRAIPEGD